MSVETLHDEDEGILVTGTLLVSVVTRVRDTESLEEAIRLAKERFVKEPSERWKYEQLTGEETYWVVTDDLSGRVANLMAVRGSR